MSVILKKGEDYTALYSSTDYQTLDTDWTATTSFYAAYPGGTPVFSKDLTRTSSNFVLNLTAGEILNLDAGVYSMVTTCANTVLGVELTGVEYATVTDVVISTHPMTTITMTIAKIDSTPTGAATKTLQNTETGAVVVNGWKGVQVTARQTDAYNIGTDIIGVETISTETNAAGYAELSVIKGSTVTVACPSFGKAVTVDTTGLDTVDLSTYF